MVRFPFKTFLALALAVAGITGTCAPFAQAGTIYVDNLLGNDRLDGLADQVTSGSSGPVATLKRAVQLAGAGDQILLVPRPRPYYGGVCLHGLSNSGTPTRPIEINGNGAILTGARPVAPHTWQFVEGDIWRITPVRKGWYQLVHEGAAVPEIECPADAEELPELQPMSWCAFQGRIYFRAPPTVAPATLQLELADVQTGITLIGVENIIIRNLTVRHFRQDGVHLHDRCKNVVLDNVICTENGRAGIVAGGTSEVLLFESQSVSNRQYSLLVEDFAAVESQDTELVPQGVVIPR